jgi:hypothetical protein
MRIEREQILQRSGRPAVLAGVHVGDGFFEKRAFLAVSDHTTAMRPGGGFSVRFLRGFLVGPHSTTLADRSKIRDGFLGHFASDFVSVWFQRSLGEAKPDEEVQS